MTHSPMSQRRSFTTNGCACRHARACACRIGRRGIPLAAASVAVQVGIQVGYRSLTCRWSQHAKSIGGFVRAVFVAVASLTTAAFAQPPAASAPVAEGSSIGSLLFGLLAVVAVIPAALWLLKRMGPSQQAQVAGLKVIAQLPLGPRERIVVLEAGDRWLLLGVTATTITRIGTLPKGATPPPSAAIASFASLMEKVRK